MGILNGYNDVIVLLMGGICHFGANLPYKIDGLKLEKVTMRNNLLSRKMFHKRG